MTAERYRLPNGMAALTCAHPSDLRHGGDADVRDLFGASMGNAHNSPHPDFAARAAIWRDHSAGLISVAEAQRRSANVGRALERRAKSETGSVSRHARSAPTDSRQYAGDMATTAARDDRLIPQAKALLQVLRARCGRGRETATCKTTLAAIMSRSTRTIARHLRDLEKLGYIATRIRTTEGGLHLGLTITITELTLPFYETAGALAAWLASTPDALERPFSGRVLSGKQGTTRTTPKNQSSNISILQRLRNGFRGDARAIAAPS